MSDDPVLALTTAIEEKERATLGLGPVAAARIEAELATLDRYLEMSIPTSAEGAAVKLQRSARYVPDEFQDEECAEPAEILLHHITEQVTHGRIQPVDVNLLRFMAAVLRNLNEDSSAADLIGSTLQWLVQPKLV